MIDLNRTELTIPNLAKMGIVRKCSPQADLDTIWATPYPVLTNYQILMKLAGLQLFAGGSRHSQGRQNIDGYITSGYRDEIIGENDTSPHRFGIAIDVRITDTERQISIAHVALMNGLFTRIGFYPDRGFIHLDLAPDNWITRYDKVRFWISIGKPDDNEWGASNQYDRILKSMETHLKKKG